MPLTQAPKLVHVQVTCTSYLRQILMQVHASSCANVKSIRRMMLIHTARHLIQLHFSTSVVGSGLTRITTALRTRSISCDGCLACVRAVNSVASKRLIIWRRSINIRRSNRMSRRRSVSGHLSPSALTTYHQAFIHSATWTTVMLSWLEQRNCTWNSFNQ